MFPEITTAGGFTVSFGLQFSYAITGWLHVYAPVSIAAASGPVFVLGSANPVDYRRTDLKYFPTYTGVGLGLGFRIPIMRL